MCVCCTWEDVWAWDWCPGDSSGGWERQPQQLRLSLLHNAMYYFNHKMAVSLVNQLNLGFIPSQQWCVCLLGVFSLALIPFLSFLSIPICMVLIIILFPSVLKFSGGLWAHLLKALVPGAVLGCRTKNKSTFMKHHWAGATFSSQMLRNVMNRAEELPYSTYHSVLHHVFLSEIYNGCAWLNLFTQV